MPCSVCCLFVSYLFRVGHSTDMCSLLQENLLGGKERECIEVICTPMLKEGNEALVVVRLNVLFFFFLSTNPSPALPLREESPLICYLTVGSKQVHKQKENRLADSAWLTRKKTLVQDTS